jgi:hypothetical protein
MRLGIIRIDGSGGEVVQIYVGPGGGIKEGKDCREICGDFC